MTTSTAPPEVLSSVPGRMRIHLPEWSGGGADDLARHAGAIAGVQDASASARTRNVLVRFERGAVEPAELVEKIARLAQHAGSRSQRRREPPAAAVRRPTHARRPPKRARIAVRGLERDQDLARGLIDRLERRPGVTRVLPSPLTGRVLVEFEEATADLDLLVSDIAELEPPDEFFEEIPPHPLDPGPVIESAAKLIGAALGLTLLMTRRATGRAGPPIGGVGPGEVAAALAMLEGIPPATSRLEDTLGHVPKELFFGTLGIVSMASSGSALGLAFAGAGALRMLTETVARRSDWRDYESRVTKEPRVHAGAELEFEARERVPLPGVVTQGCGTAIGLDGMPQPLNPGALVDSGARIYGGPVTVRLARDRPFRAARREQPVRAGPYEHYMRAVGPVAIAYAIATGALTRSLARALTAALLVNPRPAIAGREAANRGAATRVLRAGVTVPGSRPDRPVRRPDVLVVEAARVVTDGWELGPVATPDDAVDEAEALRIATAISVATDSPWGTPFPPTAHASAAEAHFDGRTATARVDGRDWTLGPHVPVASSATRSLPADAQVLALRPAADTAPVALIALVPKAAPGLSELRSTCERHGVRVELLAVRETPLARALAQRLSLELVVPSSAVARVRALQGEGQVVAVLADGVRAGEAFDICDLAIGLTSGRSGRFLARADLLAPRLDAVVAIIEAGIRRDAVVHDGVALSVAANMGGIAWGLRSSPPFSRGSVPSQVGGLAAMAVAALRLAGGRRSLSVAERLSDPLPERWGRRDVAAVLRHFDTRSDGLTAQEVAARAGATDPGGNGANPLLLGMLEQIRSPLVAVLGVGAGVSLAAGAMGDVLMIGAVVVANAIVGALQERQGGQAIEALKARGAPTARVRRDGRDQVVSTSELVPGDILLLVAGQRVAADARVIEAMALEVDEAPLTGESLPVEKSPDRGGEAERIVLEGSDVRAGSGLAVVVAVGAATRMGALAAAIHETPRGESVLDRRLAKLLSQTLPLVALGGAVVAASGLAWGNALGPQLALGASVAIAAVPEGLPLLAGVAEAAVARRLGERNALVARLAAVEALGRIDVACTDKTGTLTEGRLAVTAVCDVDGVTAAPGALRTSLREILVVAALASPRPTTTAASAHATDAAVIEAARAEGIRRHLRARREHESPFDAARGYHSTLAEGRLAVKGAVEVLAGRCSRVRRGGRVELLNAAGRRALLARADTLAGQGLRVLMIAEGGARTSASNPRELTALGLLAISDPLRPAVPAAIARCTAAGVRTIMITGDHPATAISIACAAGLPAEPENVMTGPEIRALDDDALGARLETTYVIARSTPLDKLQIVEALQSRGHVVAMTGDGVNDAPSLRLADVGVAMGSGTEVARQAADLVVMDNEFATLAEALVEGRAFWQNMRRALGLLLGGNAGEVGLVTAATIAGLGPALTTRQVLAINLVTDVLPAVAIAVQPPEHRDLAALAREGGAALDAPLRDDIVRRALATAIASFGAYAVAAKVLPAQRARTVGFTSVVTTQLAQTLDLGQAEGKLSRSVAGAVALSLAFVLAASTAPPLRAFLGLRPLTSTGAALSAAASIGAVVLSRALPTGTTVPTTRR